MLALVSFASAAPQLNPTKGSAVEQAPQNQAGQKAGHRNKRANTGGKHKTKKVAKTPVDAAQPVK